MSKILKKFYAIIGMNPSKGQGHHCYGINTNNKKKIKMIPLDVEIKGCKDQLKKSE